MITISNLKKEYKTQTVVDIPELVVAQSESFGIVGNNGAGKTTLFRIILDLVRPTSGEVRINGTNVQGNNEWKTYVGAYLDENFLIPYLTPEEYFRFVGKLYGYSNEDLKNFNAKFEALFNDEVLGKGKYIGDLSKGNLKKVGIAAAFIGNPQILILDEPFENLDPTSQIRLKVLLKHEQTLHNITYLISSHDLTHITDVCNRIVVLEKGKMIRDIKDSENAMRELEEYFKA